MGEAAVAHLTWPKVLLVLHAVAAGVAAGAVIHNAVLAFRRQVLGRRVNARLQRLYPRLALVAWLVTMGLGLAIYPTFRVEVRAAWLDEAAPLGTALFEVKEHWSAVALALLVYLASASRRVAGDDDAPDRALYHGACLLAGLVAAFALVVGLGLTALRAV